jgi:hypothetical protein
MIQSGLEELLGSEVFEYWNAGIEGYATAQEVAYYRRYLAALEPDRVVLTFHLNDFQSTPVTFMDGERMVMVYARKSSRALNPWLLRHSLLYRLYMSWRVDPGALFPRAVPDGVFQEIESSLEELRNLVEGRGGKLAVVVLPWLRPVEDWPRTMRKKHDWALATLARLGIEHYAFLTTLESALADGVQVKEKPNDPQHPSAEFGRRMARDMIAAGFSP